MSEMSRTQTTQPGWYPDQQGVSRWWDGHQWTQHTQQQQPVPHAGYNQTVYVPVPQKRGVNHLLHLVLSILTVGLWVPVWIILALANS